MDVYANWQIIVPMGGGSLSFLCRDLKNPKIQHGYLKGIKYAISKVLVQRKLEENSTKQSKMRI